MALSYTVIGTTGAGRDISPSAAPAEHVYDPKKKGADVTRYTICKVDMED